MESRRKILQKEKKDEESWEKLLFEFVVEFVVEAVVLAMELFPFLIVVMGTCFIWDKEGGLVAFATFIALLSMYIVYVYAFGEMISKWFGLDDEKERKEVQK